MLNKKVVETNTVCYVSMLSLDDSSGEVTCQTNNSTLIIATISAGVVPSVQPCSVTGTAAQLASRGIRLAEYVKVYVNLNG